MRDSEIRKVLERHWYYAGKDEAISNEMYDEDAVLEFPQSGERFRGRANFQAWRERYPSAITMEIRRLRGAGDFWVAETSSPTRRRTPGRRSASWTFGMAGSFERRSISPNRFPLPSGVLSGWTGNRLMARLADRPRNGRR
jgi:hypothetical protein